MVESKALGAQGYLVKGYFRTAEFVESILLATECGRIWRGHDADGRHE